MSKPPIDRTAEDAETSAAAIAAAQDHPMPTVENDPGSVFRPGSGIGSADVHEIVLMYLLHLTNSPVQVAPGTLRGVPLPADRVAQLSESAQRFMQPLIPPQSSH
ncbi:hypothetical protein [Methylobacterium gnaphalii]|uniref:Uncharacterized protein n=1 Tax=Methylobacterium gnaphalii TaxID=1010610 RepID=A0A512JMC5_9HYPH|nr:hypothetical protein [Methylobacterium gnaphalii]GEP11119.1 hypothetical protein MGN01_29640 [Methylobacterium gnaphalii]GJD69909.1 hypothetical protein MMMDOFMJ_2848 [Methylobacterium gnaphalii]GLS50397.1 hypothetical protein GCM10007885_32490 [Methylobacterium gnaphalii]